MTNMWPDAERPWYGTFVQTQAASLQAAGIGVDTLAIRGYAATSNYAAAAVTMAKSNLRQGYDVIHAHYGHSGVVARLQVRVPLVLSYCGDDLLGTPDLFGRLTVRSRVQAALLAQFARSCAATITKSEQMAQQLPKACLSRNAVIPNGVDLTRFRPIARSTARRKLGWALEGAVVLFAGDPAVPRKNFRLAQASVDALKSAVPQVELRVATGVAPDEMPLWMNAADALLLTSRAEGSANVLKEAMACELPVVATRVGDAEERLRDVTGCHLCPADPRPLSAALAAALAGGRTTQARHAVATISVEAVASRVIAVYESVLARPSSG